MSAHFMSLGMILQQDKVHISRGAFAIWHELFWLEACIANENNQ